MKISKRLKVSHHLALAIPAAPARLEFGTDSRDDLFQLGYILADALPDDVLQQSGHPLLIAVDGAFQSGKKIIPDAMRERLFDDAPQLSGRKDYDESWSGRHKSHDLEFDFLNAAWSSGYADRALSETFISNTRTEIFLRRRKKGGVTFIHNTYETGKVAGIAIEIKPKSLFDPSWKRTVKINVRDQRLLANPLFMETLRTLPDQLARRRADRAASFAHLAARYSS